MSITYIHTRQTKYPTTPTPPHAEGGPWVGLGVFGLPGVYVCYNISHSLSFSLSTYTCLLTRRDNNQHMVRSCAKILCTS